MEVLNPFRFKFSFHITSRIDLRQIDKTPQYLRFSYACLSPRYDGRQPLLEFMETLR